MEPVLSDVVLQFRPDTVRAVRAMHGLDGPGRMEEAVRLLDDWVKKQPHFMMKDFSRRFLETTIIASKGSVEKAKSRMDKYCTVRSLVPSFFDKVNILTDLNEATLPMFYMTALPKLDLDYNRIILMKFNNCSNITPATMSDCFAFATVFIEYIKAHDYFNGFIFIVDFTDFNMVEIISKVNWMETNQWYTFLLNGYGYRILSIHLISSSKLVEVFAGLFKKVLPAKLGDRFRFHEDREKLHEVVPREALPQDYGGDEKPLKEVFDRWVSVLSSPAHVRHMGAMRAARTDEARRPPGAAGGGGGGGGGRDQLAGTFRTLSVD